MTYTKLLLMKTADLQQAKTIILNNEHAEIPQEILMQLSQSRDSKIVSALAAWQGLPFGMLDSFVHSAKPQVRVGAAKNPNLTDAQVSDLSKDEDTSVRMAIASKDQLPTEVLDEMCAQEKDEKVKLALSQRKDLTRQQDQNLRQTTQIIHDPRIKQNLAKNVPIAQEEMGNIAANGDELEKAALASRTDLPEQIMSLLAVDPAEGVRAALAQNKSVPTNILDKIYSVRSKSMTVKKHLAKNPNISQTVANGLSIDENVEVRHALAFNEGPSLTEPILIQLIKYRDKDIRTGLQELNSLIAKRDNLTPGVLSALQQNGDERVSLQRT